MCPGVDPQGLRSLACRHPRPRRTQPHPQRRYFPGGGNQRTDQETKCEGNNIEDYDVPFDDTVTPEGNPNLASCYISKERSSIQWTPRVNGRLRFCPPTDWAGRVMPPQKMGPLRYIIRQLSWCEGKSVLLTALWVKVKVIDYEGADVVVGRFSRYPAQRLMDMYCKEHVFDQELRTARAALRTESKGEPIPTRRDYLRV